MSKVVTHLMEQVYRQAHVDARRYLDLFIRLKCAPDLLALGVYPDAKEIQESMGAFEAVASTLGHPLLGDPSIAVLAVGDGCTPRTGALFAFRSRWQVYSVDPALKGKANFEARCRNLHVVQACVEDWELHASGRVVVVAVHSHAPLEAAVDACKYASRVDVFALPCCKPQVLGMPPDSEVTDWRIGSPARQVRYWLDVPRKVRA